MLAGVRLLLNTGIGLTVTVNVCADPIQDTELFVKTGVTDTVLEIGLLDVLVAVNEVILSTPLLPEPSPVAVLLLVQL
jgi:hypothetical protein